MSSYFIYYFIAPEKLVFWTAQKCFVTHVNFVSGTPFSFCSLFLWSKVCALLNLIYCFYDPGCRIKPVNTHKIVIEITKLINNTWLVTLLKTKDVIYIITLITQHKFSNFHILNSAINSKNLFLGNITSLPYSEIMDTFMRFCRGQGSMVDK